MYGYRMFASNVVGRSGFAERAAVGVAVAIAFVASGVEAQPPASCSGTPNTFPVWSGQPSFLNSTVNGSKYVAAPADYSAPLLVMHLYGSDYDMGYAYGTLLRQEIQTLVPEVWQYLQSSYNFSQAAIDDLLDLTFDAIKDFTPSHWFDMIKGVGDGCGLPDDIRRLSMLPELIKAQCSIVGAWGSATASGSLVQLRALDWDTDGPFQQYPVLATFHPTGGYAHTTLGWAGLVGAITGFSSSGMAISEKVWDAYKGTENIFGYPFHFVLQDILRYDMDTDSALSRIATANRTCSIWIGLGDGNANSFKLVSYSNQLVQIWNPNNFVPYQNHDHFNDLLFINKHVQPSTEPCMNDVFHWLYGTVNATDLYQYVAALEETGDMHIAVYDFASSTMYVSNASPGDGHGNGVVPAYNRPFLQFNMTQLWNLAPPSESTGVTISEF